MMTDVADAAIERKFMIMIWIPRFSGILSVIGSSLIAYVILRDYHKRTRYRTRHRLLLMMCFIDIPYSVALALSTVPIPTGTQTNWGSPVPYDIYGAVGNTATCLAQGFFVQLGLAVPCYSCALSTYYFIRIRRNVDKVFDPDSMGYIEPVMHAVAFLFPFCTAISGVAMGLFNSSDFLCWIEPYPASCKWNVDVQCTRGQDAFLYQILFFAWVIVVAFFVIIANTVLICWTVWGKERASRSWLLMQRRSSGGGNGDDQPTCEVRSMFQTKETAKQMLLYVWAFVITCIWPMILVLANQTQTSQTTSFVLNVLLLLFLPSQGFWNFLAFIRPRYIFAREEGLEVSRWKAVRKAILGNPTSRLETMRRAARTSRLSGTARSSFDFRSGGGAASPPGADARYASTNSDLCEGDESIHPPADPSMTNTEIPRKIEGILRNSTSRDNTKRSSLLSSLFSSGTESNLEGCKGSEQQKQGEPQQQSLPRQKSVTFSVEEPDVSTASVDEIQLQGGTAAVNESQKLAESSQTPSHFVSVNISRKSVVEDDSWSGDSLICGT